VHAIVQIMKNKSAPIEEPKGLTRRQILLAAAASAFAPKEAAQALTRPSSLPSVVSAAESLAGLEELNRWYNFISLFKSLKEAGLYARLSSACLTGKFDLAEAIASTFNFQLPYELSPKVANPVKIKYVEAINALIKKDPSQAAVEEFVNNHYNDITFKLLFGEGEHAKITARIVKSINEGPQAIGVISREFEARHKEESIAIIQRELNPSYPSFGNRYRNNEFPIPHDYYEKPKADSWTEHVESQKSQIDLKLR
jgi:hypothetical protein